MKTGVMILAAGRSTRFRGRCPKVLHPLCGRPMVSYVLDAAAVIKPTSTVLVCSPDHIEAMRTTFGNLPKVRYTVQTQARGTADAVQAGLRNLSADTTHVLILAGDVPLLTDATIRRFLAQARKSPAGALLTMSLSDPTGYGRVQCTSDRTVVRIVEERDADATERQIGEVNTGVWWLPVAWLKKTLRALRPANAQGELYLTDVAQLAHRQSAPLSAICAPDAAEFIGVNTRVDLAQVTALLRHRLTTEWMLAGVTMDDPTTVALDPTVTIGEETVIGAHVTLRGATRIGRRCMIDTGAVLTDVVLADGVQIKPYSVLDDSRIGAGCTIGPFARIRPGTVLAADVHIGNFVETKKAIFAAGAKANHLSYLGDATIGAGTNIGCGTITCNYDGVHKHPTIIGKNVFVGSDTAFVAPVRIGDGATIAAGSVITDDVPARSLALARGRQVVKRGWKKRTK